MTAEDLHTAGPTYPEVGATLAAGTVGELPAGYDHTSRRIWVGEGVECFERTGAAVMEWAAQRGIGLRVAPDEPVTEGADVLLTAPWLPGIRIPCRVVGVVREPRRTGFAYGSLPGHPERGEELFLVTRDPDGTVWCTIRAFSRPGRWYTRLAAPVARGVQLWATGRYLRAVARAGGDPKGEV